MVMREIYDGEGIGFYDPIKFNQIYVQRIAKKIGGSQTVCEGGGDFGKVTEWYDYAHFFQKINVVLNFHAFHKFKGEILARVKLFSNKEKNIDLLEGIIRNEENKPEYQEERQ